MTEHHEETRRQKERRHVRGKSHRLRNPRKDDEDGAHGRPRFRDDEDEHFDWRRLSLDDDDSEE